MAVAPMAAQALAENGGLAFDGVYIDPSAMPSLVALYAAGPARKA